jgi:hypothetical protein
MLLCISSIGTRRGKRQVIMQEYETTDPDQQLREWAEAQGVWSNGSADPRHGTGADALNSLGAEMTFSTAVESDCTEGDKQTPPALSHVSNHPGEHMRPYVSNAATIICVIGCLSVAVALAQLAIGYYLGVHKAADSYATILNLSAALSGLMLVGFGTIVENVARIEQHLRHRP